MNSNYPRHRPIGQRLLDGVLATAIALVLYVPIRAQARADRKAARQ